MSEQLKPCEREAFEHFCREVRKLSGPYLRDCNDPEPDREYQDFDTQYLYSLWNTRPTPDVVGDVVNPLPSWHPINTVPKDGTDVILGIIDEDGDVIGLAKDYWYADRVMGDWESWNEIYDQPPTHWMVLPNQKPKSAMPQGKAQEITTPLNGGIRQASEPSGFGLLDSTSRESLPNSCERGDTQTQPVTREELTYIIARALPSKGIKPGGVSWEEWMPEAYSAAYMIEVNYTLTKK